MKRAYFLAPNVKNWKWLSILSRKTSRSLRGTPIYKKSNTLTGVWWLTELSLCKRKAQVTGKYNQPKTSVSNRLVMASNLPPPPQSQCRSGLAWRPFLAIPSASSYNYIAAVILKGNFLLDTRYSMFHSNWRHHFGFSYRIILKRRLIGLSLKNMQYILLNDKPSYTFLYTKKATEPPCYVSVVFQAKKCHFNSSWPELSHGLHLNHTLTFTQAVFFSRGTLSLWASLLPPWGVTILFLAEVFSSRWCWQKKRRVTRERDKQTAEGRKDSFAFSSFAKLCAAAHFLKWRAQTSGKRRSISTKRN